MALFEVTAESAVEHIFKISEFTVVNTSNYTLQFIHTKCFVE
jgi:hypothetical protein